MTLTVLLAQVFGIYAIIVGLAVLANRRHIMLGVAALVEERFAQLVAGMITLLLGAFLVNIHNDWSTLPAGMVSFFGWAALVKGILYLLLPEASLNKMIRKINQRKWYVVDGIIVTLYGLYLAGFGYGWF